MQLLSITHKNAEFEEILYSLGIRIGYVFSENVIINGLIFEILSILNSNFSTSRKISFIKKHGLLEEAKAVSHAEEAIRTLGKQKHKSSQAIVLLRKIEKGIDDVFKQLCKALENKVYALGHLQITKEVLLQGGISFLTVADDEYEKKEEDEKIAYMSELLALDVEDKDGQNIAILLSDEFLQYEPVKNQMQNTNKDAYNTNDIILHHCFTIPNIISLTMAEMQLLRRKVMDVGASFNADANQWIGMFYDAEVSPEERLLFLKEEVAEKAKEIQNTLDENPILHAFNQNKSQSTMLHIHLGEAPFSLLLDYYKHYNMLTEKTMEVLHEKIRDNTRLQSRFPIMVVQFPNLAKTNDLIDTKEEELLTTKKSLSLD